MDLISTLHKLQATGCTCIELNMIDPSFVSIGGRLLRHFLPCPQDSHHDRLQYTSIQLNSHIAANVSFRRIRGPMCQFTTATIHQTAGRHSTAKAHPTEGRSSGHSLLGPIKRVASKDDTAIHVPSAYATSSFATTNLIPALYISGY
eukprot:jgi/Psemu1/2507/gm1.2507_g